MALPLDEWASEAGDRFIADTEANTGYLVHADGRFTSFRIGSGRRQVVRYAGLRYNATTPERRWLARTFHTQSDRITFGPQGRFLRLYMNGETYTKYGIHTTSNIDWILAQDDRYKSFGCILVGEQVMDILIETWKLGGESLEIITVNGVKEVSVAQNS